MPIVITNFKVRGVKHDSVPYMMKVILTNIPIPKDKDPLDRKSGAIYWYQCGEFMYKEEYIAETSRTFGERAPEGTLTHLWMQQPVRTQHQPW